MGIIIRPEPLDSSYIPAKLLHREKEIGIIRDLIITPLSMGNTTSAILFGSPGVGKTVTCKRVAREIQDHVAVYENFLAFSSIKLLLQDVLLKIGRVTLPSGTSMEYVFRALRQSQVRTGKKILLIIDEGMNAFRDQDGIYNLLRARELHALEMSIIFVSVDNPLLFMISGIRRMQFNPVIIKFDRYSADELENIISDRANLSLEHGSCPPETVRFLAETASGSGSARVAIELLQKAAYLADHRASRTVDPDDVRAAMAFVNPYVTESKLSELDFHDLLLLLSVCISLGDGTETGIQSIKESFEMVCEEYSTEKLGMQSIYSRLRELERMGLIESRIESQGQGMGTSKTVKLNDLPVSVLREKIESLIRRLS